MNDERKPWIEEETFQKCWDLKEKYRLELDQWRAALQSLWSEPVAKESFTPADIAILLSRESDELAEKHEAELVEARAEAFKEAEQVCRERTKCSCWDCSDECHRRRQGAERCADDMAYLARRTEP